MEGPRQVERPDEAGDRPAFILALCDFCDTRPWYCTAVRGPTATPTVPALNGEGRAMDEFAYFHGTDVAALIAVALSMTLWVCGIVAIDCWVTARHSGLNHGIHRPGRSGGG